MWARSEDRSGLPASCYGQLLQVARAPGARPVGFPAVSTGAYSRPVDDRARIALRTVREAGEGFDELRSVLFSRGIYETFAAQL